MFKSKCLILIEYWTNFLFISSINFPRKMSPFSFLRRAHVCIVTILKCFRSLIQVKLLFELTHYYEWYDWAVVCRLLFVVAAVTNFHWSRRSQAFICLLTLIVHTIHTSFVFDCIEMNWFQKTKFNSQKLVDCARTHARTNPNLSAWHKNQNELQINNDQNRSQIDRKRWRNWRAMSKLS